MSAYTADIQKLYVAYFNRPADVSGLAFWENAVATAKDPQAILNMISAQFATSAEYKATFAGMNEMQTVATVYSNLFSREADMDGLLFWTARLMAHDVTVDTVVAAMAAGAQGADVTTLNNKVTAATSFTKALDTPAEAIGYAGDAANAAAKAWLTGVTDDASLAVAINADALSTTIGNVIDNGAVTGVTYAMVTGLDTFTGTASNDKIIGAVDTAHPEVNTVSSIDSIDGGSGKDTFLLASATDMVGDELPTLKNIEIVEVQSAKKVIVDTSAVTGVTNLNVTKTGGTVDVTAAGTTDISVKTVSHGTVDTTGGKAVTVNVTGIAASAVPVPGENNITVTGAKGAVNVSATGAAVTAAGNTLDTIKVDGAGSTVTVNQKATSDNSVALSSTTAVTVVEGAINVIGGTATGTVVVKQDATISAYGAEAAQAGKTEVTTVKFADVTAGQSVVVGGLTFKAAVDMKAAAVATAFANLANGQLPTGGDTQGSGAASKGLYSGAITGWNSGAANGDTVTFTAFAEGDVTDATSATGGMGHLVVAAGTGIASASITTTGQNELGYDGRLGITAGAVDVKDTNGSITSVTIDGYGVGSKTEATTNLATLSLAHSWDDINIGATSATFNLSVEKVGKSGNTGDIIFADAPTTLNIKSVGTNYVSLNADSETLNVTGTGTLRADSGSTLGSLKTIKVSETAGLRLGSAAVGTLTSVDTTGTTGATNITIDGTKATFAGGAGVDTVTLSAGTSLDKSIDLGAGNDTLIFSAAVTGSSKTLSGGDGTDTLQMSVANADTLDVSAQSFYTNFERLTLGTKFGTADATGDALTLNLANLGFTNYVTTSGTMVNGVDAGATATDVLTLDKMASNGTVVLTATGSIAVNVAGAADATADVLNAVVTSATTDLDAGTLKVANVETINVAVNDVQLDNDFDGVNDDVQHDALALVADSATSVKLTGNAHIALDLTGSTKVTSVDGSALTGDFMVQAVNTTDATTIKGGAGNDTLVAANGTTADVLIGGAGQDTLMANAGLDVLTGGAGNDLFVISQPSLNSSSYATITDFAAGDLIQFASATGFKAAKIAQADTAVFQDYANAAINAINAGELAWFQYNGNTYIVMDGGAAVAGDSTFTNNTDLIVKLTGLIDLSGASFNTDHGTIGLV